VHHGEQITAISAVFCAVAYSFNVTAHIVVEQVRMKQTTTLNCAG